MEEKKYASLESLQAFKNNLDNKFATKEYVDENSVQPDWSVNDPENPAYVKNKPFDSYLSDEVIVLADNVTIGTSRTEVLLGSVTSNKAAFDAAQFTVTYNDVVYNLAIDNVAVNGVGDHLLTEYPFYIRVSAKKYWAPEYFVTVADNNAIISVSYRSEIITAIDNKYVSGKPGIVVPQGTQFVYRGIASNYEDKIVTAGEKSEIFNDLSSNVVGNSYAHVEGKSTLASGHGSHAEGEGSAATGAAAHAEGSETISSDLATHAEGVRTVASNYASHAEGYQTIAAGMYQHVQGIWNIEDGPTDEHDGKYAHIVGNGHGDDERSNAHTLDWSGNAWFQGEVKVGGTSQDDVNAKTLATTEYVDSKVTQSDWSQNDETTPDYIKNRTHWLEKEERIVEFNGDLTGREYTQIDDGVYLIKVSDKILTETEAIGSTLRINALGEIEEAIITADNVSIGDNGGSITVNGVTWILSLSDVDGFSSGGTFFVGTSSDSLDSMWVQSISCLTEEGSIYHQLDENYIPNTIARSTTLKTWVMSDFFTTLDTTKLDEKALV